MHLGSRRLLACLCFLAPAFAFAQQVTWSEPMRNERAIERVQAIAQADTVLHVVEERDNHSLRHVRYNWNTLRQLGFSDINPTDERSQPAYFFILNDTLHVISTRWNRLEDCTEVMASLFDAEGKSIGAEQLVHKRNEPGEPRSSGLQCKISPSGTHILLFFDSDSERKQSDGIHFKCFRNNWTLFWEKNLRLPANNDILQVHHFLADDDGGVYMMSGRKPLKTSTDWQRPQGGQYVVFYYNSKLNKLKQYDISLKDKQVISVDFVLDVHQSLVIAGYYSDNFQNKAAGTLLFAIHPFGGPIRTATYTPFSGDFLKAMTGKEKEAPEYFYLDHLYISPTGVIVLAGEQYYTSRYISTDAITGQQVVEYRYNFDDIMVCMMDSSARHIHTIRIPKKQFTSNTNDPNFSYAFAANNELIAITFNDDEANNLEENSKKRKDTHQWNGSKNSVTTRVELDYGGVMKRHTIVHNSSERLLFNPLMQPTANAGAASAAWAIDLLGFEDKRTYKFCRIR